MTTREALLELITSATEPTKIVTRDIADRLGVSNVAVFKALKALVRELKIEQVGRSLFVSTSQDVNKGVNKPLLTQVEEGAVNPPKPLGPNTLESGRLIDADIPQDLLLAMTKAELDEVIARGPERHQMQCLKENQRRKHEETLAALPQGMTKTQYYREKTKEISKKKLDRHIQTTIDDPKYADTIGLPITVKTIMERKLDLPTPEPKN